MNNISLTDFPSTTPSPILIATNGWDEMEEQRHLVGRLLFLSELLLVLTVICCLIVLRWLRRSGCFKPAPIRQENRFQNLMQSTRLDVIDEDEETSVNDRMKSSPRQWGKMNVIPPIIKT